jgi:ABC-type nitrate/sulfonate/bicarbonate transport system substrate-binding protein
MDPDKDVQLVAVGSHANRTAALLAGSIDAGVDDPPEDEELVKAGLNPILDLAAQKIPAVNTSIVVQRSYLNGNKDTIQGYIDATVVARAKMAKDKDGAITVLKKYFKSDNTASMEKAYTFFISGNTPVTPVYPAITADQFKDAVSILGADNDKIKSVDLAKMIDTSFVKNAQDRKLGG